MTRARPHSLQARAEKLAGLQRLLHGRHPSRRKVLLHNFARNISHVFQHHFFGPRDNGMALLLQQLLNLLQQQALLVRSVT